MRILVKTICVGILAACLSVACGGSSQQQSGTVNSPQIILATTATNFILLPETSPGNLPEPADTLTVMGEATLYPWIYFTEDSTFGASEFVGYCNTKNSCVSISEFSWFPDGTLELDDSSIVSLVSAGRPGSADRIMLSVPAARPISPVTLTMKSSNGKTFAKKIFFD